MGGGEDGTNRGRLSSLIWSWKLSETRCMVFSRVMLSLGFKLPHLCRHSSSGLMVCLEGSAETEWNSFFISSSSAFSLLNRSCSSAYSLSGDGDGTSGTVASIWSGNSLSISFSTVRSLLRAQRVSSRCSFFTFFRTSRFLRLNSAQNSFLLHKKNQCRIIG